MNITEFWNHIEGIKNSKLPAKDLMEILEKLPPEEILSFKWHFENVYEFAGRVDLYHAADMLIGWCDWDTFADFRAAMIAKGKQVYESILKNPDSLVDFWDDKDVTDDAFSYVPARVYKAKTGTAMPKSCYDGSGEYIFEDGTILADDENWGSDHEKENKKHFPKLSERYYGGGRININHEGRTLITRTHYSEDLSMKTYALIMISKKNNR